MIKLIEKAKSLINVLSEDCEDYPDMSAYRQVMDKKSELEREVEKAENRINFLTTLKENDTVSDMIEIETIPIGATPDDCINCPLLGTGKCNNCP